MLQPRLEVYFAPFNGDQKLVRRISRQSCATLTDVDSNICHGTLILARNLRRTRTTTAALLCYNGCVRGTNTPDCHRYPSRVLARAGRVRQQILAARMRW